MDDEFIEQYFALPFPKAIHFRLATHGGKIPQLTHPFPIKRGNPHDLKGKAKAVLFHNGIWHAYDDRLREAVLGGTLNPNILSGGMSDSRAMAVLAQRFGEDILDILNLGQNKVLVLREDTFYRYGSWTEKEGWSASNSKIFRFVSSVSTGVGTAAKGVPLSASGLPLKGYEVEGGVKPGHLNRHGNVRSRFRGGYVRPGERDLGPTSGQVDASGAVGVKEHDKRDLPSGGYLTATAEQLAFYHQQWGEGMN